MYGFSSLVAALTACSFPFFLHHLFVCSDYVKKKCCYIDAHRGKNTYKSGFISEGKQTREIYVHPQQKGASAAPKKTEKLTTVELQLYLFIAPQNSDIHSTSVSFFFLFLTASSFLKNKEYFISFWNIT